jgi:hypothetical protein
MLSLRDLQANVRRAIVCGDVGAIAPLLVGGGDSRTRLAIHRRHYRASLVNALLEKFPATVWLTGSAFPTEAARQFVAAHPPDHPCIAEYGKEFPAFLAALPTAAHLPYLRDFAELERRVGEQRTGDDRRGGRTEPTADWNVRRRVDPHAGGGNAAGGARGAESPREEVLVRPHPDRAQRPSPPNRDRGTLDGRRGDEPAIDGDAHAVEPRT